MKKLLIKLIEKLCKVKKVQNDKEKVELNELDFRDKVCSEEEVKKGIEDIISQLFSKGYKALPEILSQFPEQIVKAYVVSQLVQLGEYDSEKDALEELSYDELIEKSVELNYLQFRMRMIEQGKAKVSKPQKDLIERLVTQIKARNPNFEYKVPTNKFEASDLIVELNKILGRDNEKNELINNMTRRQYNKLKYLTDVLGKEMPKVNSVQEASAEIQKLQAILDTRPDLKVEPMCSQAQLEYMKRLYQMEGKRWIKTSAAKYMKLTRTEMSKEIQKKRDEIYANNPKLFLASKGQVSFMADLMRNLQIPFNIDDLKKMTKEQASKKISELRRETLYIACKTTSPMSREEIKKLSDDAVKELLRNIRMENRTNYYQEDPDVVDEKYGEITN